MLNAERGDRDMIAGGNASPVVITFEFVRALDVFNYFLSWFASSL
jgi:hypothetical protein